MSSGGHHGTRTPAVAWLLLAFLLSSALWVWSSHRIELDDAYISYRYAANLAAGEGLVFNPGERVEGYSNFLWVLLLAAMDLGGAPPHRAGPWLGVTALLAALAVGWLAVWRPGAGLPPDTGRGVLATTMLGTLVTAHGFAATAGSGLETHFFALLILAAGVALAHADLQRTPDLLALGSLPALLLLTRPDGVLPGAVLLLVAAWSSARERGDWRIGLLSSVIAAAPALVTGIALVVFKARYFGELVPNPYYAKGADSSHLDAGLAYLLGFLRSYPFVGVGLVIAGALFARRSAAEHARRLSAFAVGVAIVYGGFLVKIGGDFMEYRLALQLLPLIVVAAALASVELLPNRWALTVAGLAMLGLSLFPVVLEQRFYMQDLAEMDRYANQGGRVGRALAGLPEETRIATTLIGTVGYFSGQHIIDQWGLVDPRVRDRTPRRRYFRGHVRYTGRDEARRLGAQLFLDHPHLCRCLPECIRHGRDVLVATGGGECVRARVLDLGPAFTGALCADERRFPVAGPGICPDGRRPPQPDDPPAAD